MGVKRKTVVVCDYNGCGVTADSDSEYDLPSGWSQVNITIWEDQPECKCQCHDSDDEDFDDHEEWDCDTCAEYSDREEHELVLCPSCTTKIRPRKGAFL